MKRSKLLNRICIFLLSMLAASFLTGCRRYEPVALEPGFDMEMIQESSISVSLEEETETEEETESEEEDFGGEEETADGAEDAGTDEVTEGEEEEDNQ